ncbi:uncharacterized protein [Nicotiana sylvestris]|uniref:uncharacterized protein n=1 Tax=Nicotiana sylvestris TaxID=4096 RepID=UPI00388CE9F4
MAINQYVEELLIMGDSDMIIRQAQGEWETRDVKLIPYRQHVEDLGKRFKSIEFRYIPYFHNELADALATLASMLPYPGNAHIDPLEIQIRERHGYCNTIEAESNVQPWYHDIKRFLKTKQYPEQASGDQKRTIRRYASGFFLSGDVLYKRTPNLNLLKYVDAEEAGKIMYEVHAGVCGPPHEREVKGKFAPNWKGPYIIRKILPRRALYLGDIEGNDLEAAVNADAVKRYIFLDFTEFEARLEV